VVFIGTSGWQYRDWRGSFYPEKLPQRLWLEHYVKSFQTVELNNAFYRLPAAETFAGWRRRTPRGFVMAVKASRYLTHIKRLKDPGEPVGRFMDQARNLGPKLGPVLIQLPPGFHVDAARLADTLSRFPARVRLAVEVRHDSWLTDEVRELLRERGAAFCLADSPWRRLPLWRTADWGFLRLHEGKGEPRPCYQRAALDSWAGSLAETWDPTEDVFVYFNNDHRCCAVHDAVVFAELVARRGLRPSRVPEPDQVRVVGT
jgi:uncharacterized protein YecE (DUF72 family)